MKLYKSLPQPEGLQFLVSKDVCVLDIIEQQESSKIWRQAEL